MKEKKLAKLFYADLWGLRKDKYQCLFAHDVQSTPWQELHPLAPQYFFIPKDFTLQAEYDKFWKVTEIFKECSFGVTTSRDHFVVGFTKEEITQKLKIFTGQLPDALVSQSLNLKDTGTWRLAEARQKIRNQKPETKIYFYAYRPFDNRWICYESSLIERDRRDIMHHILNRESVGLNFTRRLRDPVWRHVYATSFITDKTILSSRDNSYFFPLYLYPSEPVGARCSVPLLEAHRTPNLTPEFLKAVGATLELPLQKENLEEIFYYIYAVLYSPTYRTRYAEFLKIDFPRLPLTSDLALFKALAAKGKELTDLHLMHWDGLRLITSFPISGSDEVAGGFPRYTEPGRVYINKEQYFEGIEPEVWNFHIGGYQVLQKWLKDRQGRAFDLVNYQKTVSAIKETLRLMAEIDGLIPSWPLS